MKHRRWSCVMADTHGLTHDPPRPVDFIVIAGDICPDRHQFADRSMDKAEGQAHWLDTVFREWLDRQDCPVIACWGNHDFIGERPELWPDLPWTLLHDSGAEVAGLSFWGSGWTRSTGALQCKSDEELAAHWEKIPSGIDVLVTHQPPTGYGDVGTDRYHGGSDSLVGAIDRARPLLHLFGHIHGGRGHWRRGCTLLLNCTLGAHNGRQSTYVPWGLADSSWRDHDA